MKEGRGAHRSLQEVGPAEVEHALGQPTTLQASRDLVCRGAGVLRCRGAEEIQAEELDKPW